ncbi:MAG: hypothetical protein ACRDP6_24580 [Actinoallomurus sp.]
MLTAACLTVALATLGLCCWGAYWIGRTSRPASERYLAARASGYQAGIRHGENARRALQARADTLHAALDEMGERYDQKVAEPLLRAVELATGEITLTGAEVYDHEEAGL